MGILDLFRRKKNKETPEKKGVDKLEDILQYERQPSEEEVSYNRRQFLKNAGGFLGTITVFYGSCVGTCALIVKNSDNSQIHPKVGMPGFDKEKYEKQIQSLADDIREAARSERVPEYILEGMVLACSQNRYSPQKQQQGLGGVVLLDPLEAGATIEMLNRDPSLSLKLAARKYRKILATARDDEQALAIFFSSAEDVEKADEQAWKSLEQEMTRVRYLGEQHNRIMMARKRNYSAQLKYGPDSKEVKKGFKEAHKEVFLYPNPNLEFMKDHEKNQAGMYFVNNLNDYAREAVKLVMAVHPGKNRYWSRARIIDRARRNYTKR